MLEFLRPIVNVDTWLYVGLGLLALFFLRLIWIARNDRARSIFTLERENATIRMTRAFTGFLVVLGLMLGVYYLSLITPRVVPPAPETPTPTPIISLPDTPTPPPLLPTPTITPTPLPAPTLAALVGDENTPTPPPLAPAAPQVQPPNCPNPGSKIVRPGNGDKVAGVIQIVGAASIENFEYYKFEFRPAASAEDWNFINRYNNSVVEGVLGDWNTDTVPPGEYELRLVVVDNTGNFPEPCVTRLIVQ
jgi:hypothetical protein